MVTWGHLSKLVDLTWNDPIGDCLITLSVIYYSIGDNVITLSAAITLSVIITLSVVTGCNVSCTSNHTGSMRPSADLACLVT